MDQAALRAYYAEPMGNAALPHDNWTAQPYETYNAQGEPVTIVPLHPLQDLWLGLGAQAAIQEWVIAHSESTDLESQYVKLARLERQQLSLELLLKAKKLAIPDPEAWRHPQMPYGWKETYVRECAAFPHKSVSEMTHGGKGQTGEGKKKARKFRKIHPKPSKIKT